MRPNLKTVLALGIAVAAAVTGHAVQARPGADGGVKQRMEKMKLDLGLTDEQARKIEAILNEAAPKREALQANGRAASREGEGTRRQVRAKIDAVLTEEQRKKRDEIIAKRQKNRERSAPSGPPRVSL